jgi:hypothetical protein
LTPPRRGPILHSSSAPDWSTRQPGTSPSTPIPVSSGLPAPPAAPPAHIRNPIQVGRREHNCPARS